MAAKKRPSGLHYVTSGDLTRDLGRFLGFGSRVPDVPPGGPGDGDGRGRGGAGVREPRKPRPTRPGAAQTLTEPLPPPPPMDLTGG